MRTSGWIRIATAIVLGSLFTPLALAGGVRIVGPNSGASVASIQSAVNAASDGDVLLIGAGTYAAFTIDAKERRSRNSGCLDCVSKERLARLIHSLEGRDWHVRRSKSPARWR